MTLFSASGVTKTALSNPLSTAVRKTLSPQSLPSIQPPKRAMPKTKMAPKVPSVGTVKAPKVPKPPKPPGQFGRGIGRLSKMARVLPIAGRAAVLEMHKAASVDVYVGPSDEMDRGVFADRDFKPGEIIETAPVLVVPRSQIKEHHVLRDYVFRWDDEKVMVALGYASMFNHSYDPNARYKKHKGNRTLTFTAIKPIKKGEEIFVNYNMEPESKKPLWFDVKEKQMEKEAVTLQQLRQAAGRINYKVPAAGDDLAHMMGGVTLPTRRQQATETAKRFEKWQEKLLGPGLVQQVRGPYEALMRKHAPGTVFVSPGVGRVVDPNASRKRMQGLHDMTVVHESAERRAPFSIGSLHANPEVLAKDFNMTSRLKGPGARGVRRSFEQIRAPEYAKMRDQLVGKFGPRAAELMQPGQKIPKAMRKRIRQGLPLSPEEGQQVMRTQASGHKDKVLSRSVVPLPEFKPVKLTEEVLSFDDPDIAALMAGRRKTAKRVVPNFTKELPTTALERELAKLAPKGVTIKRGLGNYYRPSTKEIVHSGTSPYYLAHEIGHAKNYALVGSKAVHLRTPFMLMHGNKNRQVVAPLLGLLGGRAAQNLGDRRDSDLPAALAVGVPAALAAPTLVDEATASARGLAMLRRVGVKGKPFLKGVGRLGHAFSTYALPPAALAASTFVGVAIAKAKNQQKGKEKIAEALPFMRKAIEEMCHA